MIEEVYLDDYYNVENYGRSGIYKVVDSTNTDRLILVLKRAGFALDLTVECDNHVENVLEDLREICSNFSLSNDIDHSDNNSSCMKDTVDRNSIGVDEIIKIIAVSQKPELVKDLVK